MSDSPETTISLIRELKKDLAEAKKSFTKAVDEFKNNSDVEDLNYSKAKLIDSDEVSDEGFKQYNKLEKAQRIVLGIDQTAIEVQKELHHQTSKMMRVNNGISTMNFEIDDSNSVLKTMLKRESKSRLLIFGVATVFVILFIVILIFKFSGASSAELQSDFNQPLNQTGV